MSRHQRHPASRPPSPSRSRRKEGVTTGISAADRARTISVAIDAAKGREHIVTPGHVFPLVARDGGVLVRAGHTEAAVDVARLAGLNPSGVICEIMDEDGTMARMDDLVRLRPAPRPQDRHDPRPDRLSPAERPARRADRRGPLREPLGRRLDRARPSSTRRSGASRSRWSKGHVDPAKPTLVRMHALSLVHRRLRRGAARAAACSKGR